MKYYIIELEKGVFRADIEGDPGRTHFRKWARVYRIKSAAKSALTQIRKRYSRPFKDAEILEARNK